MTEPVLVEREGRVVTVRIANPPRNFLTMGIIRELDDLTRSIERDPSIGAVVITGAVEGFFIAHYDVEELSAGSDQVKRPVPLPAARVALEAVGALSRFAPLRGRLRRSTLGPLLALWHSQRVMLRMNRMDKVFVAAINGTALGAGCEIALASDVRLMADRDQIRIGQPEMALGLMPGGGGTQRLTRMLGPARALRLILDADPLSPAAALELGVVHDLVPADQIVERAQQVAERYARRAPASVGLVKRAVYDAASRRHVRGLKFERAGFVAASSTPAAIKAMTTYIDQLSRLGDHPMPWADDEFTTPWREGTKVDLTR